MSLTSLEQLAAAQVAIFGSLVFITIYIAFKHGRKGLMVWQILAGLEVCMIILGALHIAQNGNPNSYSARIRILTSGILSQLAIVPIGIIYEVCLFIPTIKPWTNRINLIAIHIICLLCIILGTVFGTTSRNDAGVDVPKNRAAAGTGWILLFLVLVLILTEAIYLLFYRVQDTVNARSAHLVKILLAAIIFATPFSMVRVVHEIVYLFDPGEAQNLETGRFFMIFIVAFSMPLCVVVIFVVAGFLTREIGGLTVEVVGEDGSRAWRRDEVPS
ncbi:hypothetical protein EG328_003509 [Venturia inaequalis]|uniref:DUF7702 domain-containing protein n=1 Tax=Venturia inaequalis TaxID=5025 RepID=A0A8H3UTI6_VENIN|nr:hypothetical protein EG328_003509 [Venturia inaequalis]